VNITADDVVIAWKLVQYVVCVLRVKQSGSGCETLPPDYGRSFPGSGRVGGVAQNQMQQTTVAIGTMAMVGKNENANPSGSNDKYKHTE
jgi:hypothetical protein